MSLFSICQSARPLAKAIPWAALLGGAMFVWPQLAEAAHSGPFSKLSGEWRGGGRIVSSNGGAQPITCRAHYEVSAGGASLSQSLVCASDSYRVDIRSNLVAEGQNVRGAWQETTRNISGNLYGQIVNGAFAGSVDGPGFTAGISLRTSGRRQTVEITPHAGDITRVEVALTRTSAENRMTSQRGPLTDFSNGPAGPGAQPGDGGWNGE
jgi:hypothetical protein